MRTLGLMPIPESAVRMLAEKEPGGAASKVLAEAAEIRARGNQVRFCVTGNFELCVQEGVAFTSTSEQ